MGSVAALLERQNFHDDMTDFMASKDRVEGALAHMSYANGLMTAVIVSPDTVSPSEWLPLIVDLEGTDDSIEEAQLGVNLMLFQYNKILKSLTSKKENFEPFFWKDEHEQTIAQDWAQGFVDGMRLKMDGWSPIFKDEKKRMAIIPMLVLADPERYQRERAQTEPPFDEFMDELRQMIPGAVQFLDDDRQNQLVRTSAKVGRNAPCPCGSGKKYKKCCLQ